VEALLAAAVDPRRNEKGRGLIGDEYDPDDDINGVPDADDLGTTVVPSFLNRTHKKVWAGAALRAKHGVGDEE